MILKRIILFLLLTLCFPLSGMAGMQPYGPGEPSMGSANIKNFNGKFYAYIVLLYNENPHFVNLIQKGAIPLKMMAREGFHIAAYRNYISSLQNNKIKLMASSLMRLYLEPTKYTNKDLLRFENDLSRYNIILKFSRDKSRIANRISLDYCIYGKKIPITIHHPLMRSKEKIYNIQPFIYYDEFSTSNSTFYFNMIYINMDEVKNDSIIARRIIRGGNPGPLFFVGSRVTEDIRFCLKKFFAGGNKNIQKEIWEMFVIHELTHKIVNNRYDYYDQVNGEELSLMSTIYSKPYLGLSVLYSYLNYNSINPHRIAAQNFIRFAAEKTKQKAIEEKPSWLKHLSEATLKNLAREYFSNIVKTLK